MLPEVPEYQERPQIQQLRDFWRSDTLRIAALVGIGGAGKTALVRRFLEELPGSAIVNPKVTKRADLSPPDGLFVWSFYSAPYVEEFFTEAFKFIRSCAPADVTLPELEEPRRATVFMVEEALRKVPLRFLFVLDGLEKVQSEECEGGEVSSLADFPLKQFLTRIAEGCGNTKVLITSRYPLPDLERYANPFKDEVTAYERPPSFRLIEDLDRLEPYKDLSSECEIDPAVDLLRALGVHGNSIELKKLANHYNRHVLAVNLIGQWLRAFANGDLKQAGQLPSLTAAIETLSSLCEANRVVHHVVRILMDFRKKLSEHAATLLDCLSAIDVPLRVSVLLDISTKIINTTSTKHFHVERESLLKLVQHLYSLRLIYLIKDNAGHIILMHPIVREAWYSLVKNRSQLHYIIGNYYAGFFPHWNEISDDGLKLLVLHETISHTIKSGQHRTAFQIYWFWGYKWPQLRKLGGFGLGWDILQAFTTEVQPRNESERLGYEELGHLANEKGHIAFALGRLRIAQQLFMESLHYFRKAKRSHDECIDLQNLAWLYLAQGYLPRALMAAEDSHGLAKEHSLGKEVLSRGLEACIEGLLGWTGMALSDFQSLLKYFAFDFLGVPITIMGEVGVWHALMLARLGGLEQAHVMLSANETACRRHHQYYTLARVYLALAQVMFGITQNAPDEERYRQGLEVFKGALHWGLRSGDMEVLIWAQLISAKLGLAEGNLAKVWQALRDALVNARECGYGLYWIDLQVVKGQWELACGRQLQAGRELPPELEIWTPQQWFERAEASALRALNGHLKNSDDPAPRPDLPEDQLAMLGACHPECGYAWGEGDALQLLAEARFKLAQRIGLGGYDSKGRSYSKLLEEARQAAGEALALRERIQDPKAKETQDLLRKIQEAQGGDGA